MCATRSFCLWLNKGVDVLHDFVAYDRNPLGMGLLPTEMPKLPPEAPFERVATEPMKAVRNLTRTFADSDEFQSLVSSLPGPMELMVERDGRLLRISVAVESRDGMARVGNGWYGHR